MSFCKIVKNKEHHVKVQPESFHLNGHIIGFRPQTQKLESPCKTSSSTLAVKGLRKTYTARSWPGFCCIRHLAGHIANPPWTVWQFFMGYLIISICHQYNHFYKIIKIYLNCKSNRPHFLCVSLLGWWKNARARDLQAFLVFSQHHSARVITPVNPYKVWSIA